MINLDTFVPTEANGKDAAALANKYERVLQHLMQVLGPDIPTGVDYTSPDNLAGLMAEVNEALRALREVGIEFRRRKLSPAEVLTTAQQAAAEGHLVIGNPAAARPGAVIVMSYVRAEADAYPEHDRGVLVFQWSRVGIGFGEITLTTEGGKLRADTERMSDTFVLDILRQALAEGQT